MRCTMIAILASFYITTAYAAGLAEDLRRATTIEAVQPPDSLIESIEHRPDEDAPEVFFTTDFTKQQLPYQLTNVLVENDLPYYPYYALKEGSNHVMHPMALGRFLLRNANGTKAEDLKQAALNIAYELPNGGLAWYYPRHYRVARMLGSKLKYSSISQGTILAGLTEMAAAHGDPTFRDAKAAFEAMRWPYEKGGVNLANRAVLEMPSFSGPPEIILNGWIDALLHIQDYAETTGNVEAREFFKRNVEFLAEIVANFDADSARISRYSDVSPYRIKVTLSRPGDVDTLELLYLPRIDGLPSIRVPLERTADADNFSPYENQIWRQNGRIAFVWASCSQHYDTILVSRSDEMVAEVDSGIVSRRQSTPGKGGTIVVKESGVDGDFRYVTFNKGDGLICGYPTNFSKGGKYNYYHVYHIVGLMLLAASPEVEAETATILNKGIRIFWLIGSYHDDGTNHQLSGLPG
ncbi:D-glucuronyl C5-epimerase family protein [Tepidicaulis sp. LMO-SS28]|uniref:D-glucuronyl C5-epimerase family protein n=1 Tax=Tepidicaulis sp. LMO-SS28 TaxID=3447455 RepID=UPI003EE10C33